MYDFLLKIGFQPLVANFLVYPEWVHVGSAFLLIVMAIGVAYLLRLDLDPYIFGRRQPFSATVEKLVFYPVFVGILLWMYYYKWNDLPDAMKTIYVNKFTVGGALLLLMTLGRGIVHFVNEEKNRWDFFDQLPFYLMVEFQFLVPLVYYFQLERNGLMPKEELGFALAVLFLAYFVIRMLLGRPTHLPRNPVMPWFWMFIGYIFLTFIIFPYRLAAIKNIIQWIAFASCFLVTLAYIPDRKHRDTVLLVAIVAATVCTLWGFWKYFDVPQNLFGMSQGTYEPGGPLSGAPYFYKTPSAGRYFLLAGFFANPNYYGEYLAMVLFISLGMLLATDSRRLRVFLAFSLAVNCFEEIALYNRAAWFGIFVTIGFLVLVMTWGRLPMLRRVSKVGLASGIAGLALILLLSGVIFNHREASSDTPLALTPLGRLKTMLDFKGDETFRNRLTMWRAARIMLFDKVAFPERLIFGEGQGYFEVNYLPYQTQVLETYNFNDWFHNVIPTFRAHNDHLQMVVEGGIIGVGLMWMIFISFFTLGLRELKQEPDPAKRFYALGVLAACMSMIAIAFFSFPFHEIEHGGLMFTAMAILIVQITQSRQARLALEGPSASATEDAIDAKKSKKKSRKDTAAPAVIEPQYPPELYLTIWKKFPPAVYVPLIAIAAFLASWGVYTQIINFKSQFYVVRGIAALRALDNSMSDKQRQDAAQLSANFFWRAYQLDPTNGRAEFFHGFALTKKSTYEDAVAGTQHLEEGQLLYPQSDTFYALAMGYEARRNLGIEKANSIGGEIQVDENSLKDLPDGDQRTKIEGQIEGLKKEKAGLEQDTSISLDKAIDAYATAARYYPVKVEYYKELIRLLEEEGRYDEIIFWARRAIVVYDWLLKAPPIRYQLNLSLGNALRVLGTRAMRDGKEAEGLNLWSQAEEAFNQSRMKSEKEPSAMYFYQPYYELGQMYEALGELALRKGNAAEARSEFEKARDMYVTTFSNKDNVGGSTPHFDYAFFVLGRIYEKLGDSEKAVHNYELLLTRSLYTKNTETYQRARDRILALTGKSEGEPATTQNLQPQADASDPLSWLAAP